MCEGDVASERIRSRPAVDVSEQRRRGSRDGDGRTSREVGAINSSQRTTDQTGADGGGGNDETVLVGCKERGSEARDVQVGRRRVHCQGTGSNEPGTLEPYRCRRTLHSNSVIVVSREGPRSTATTCIIAITKIAAPRYGGAKRCPRGSGHSIEGQHTSDVEVGTGRVR